jgi:hypothetical protein
MNPDYLLACAIVWRKSADPEAGLELLEALDSPDPNMRALSRALLADGEEHSMCLLEGALAAGLVSPEAAGDCIAEILRKGHGKCKGTGSAKRLWRESFIC